MNKKQCVVLVYFTLFLMLFYFIFGIYNVGYLKWSYYNPFLFAFVCAMILMYFVHLVVHEIPILEGLGLSKANAIKKDVFKVKKDISDVNKRIERIEKYLDGKKKK
jgi:hypothetical protein